MAPQIGEGLVEAIVGADQSTEAGIAAQRERVVELRKKLAGIDALEARWLEKIADYLVRKSVWIVGGDGWAYDIGYGGLDHVIAQNRNVNLLVLDTEVYSNTGGQASKATPIGASAKFAMAGKARAEEGPRHDRDGLRQRLRGARRLRREGRPDGARRSSRPTSYDGPVDHHRVQPLHRARLRPRERASTSRSCAVDTGYWPLYRFDPRRVADGENPLELDSAPPKGERRRSSWRTRSRFRVVEQQNPERYKTLLAAAQREVTMRYGLYEQLAKLHYAQRQDDRLGRVTGGHDGPVHHLPWPSSCRTR